MKYNKPQILRTETASSIIMSTQQKNDLSVIDGNPLGGTNPAYSADE